MRLKETSLARDEERACVICDAITCARRLHGVRSDVVVVG